MNITVIRRFTIFLFLLLAKSEAVVPVTIELGDHHQNPQIIGRTATHLFFLCDTPSSGGDLIDHQTLWITDGTQQGTRMLQDMGHCALTGDVFETQNHVYFRTVPVQTDSGVIITIPDTAPDFQSVSAAGLTTLNSRALFSSGGVATSYAPITILDTLGDYLYLISSFSYTGHDLWKSDGTQNGSVHLNPTSSGTLISSGISAQDYFYYISSEFSPDMRSTLYRTDGTVAGTHPLLDQQQNRIQATDLLKTQGNRLFYLTTDSATQLWRTDGTADSTIHLGTLGTINHRSQPSLRETAAFFQDRLYIRDTTSQYARLWETDGTSEGTFLVKDDLPLGSARMYSSTAGIWIAYPGTEDHELTLWFSDGTSAGTSVVATLTDYITWDDSRTSPLSFVGRDACYISPQGPVSISSTDGSTRLLRSFQDEWLTSSFIQFKGAPCFTTSRRLWILPPPSTTPEAPLTCALSLTPGKKSSIITMQGTITQQDGSPSSAIKSWFEIWSIDDALGNTPGFLTETTHIDSGPLVSGGSILTQSKLVKLVPGRNYMIRLAAQNADHISYSPFATYTMPDHPAALHGLNLDGIATSWSHWQSLGFTTQEYRVAAADTSIRITGWWEPSTSDPARILFINGKVFNKKSPDRIFKLKPGKNTLKITSYSSGYKKKQTYTLTLIRPKAS
jgi:hypothetical protein